MNTESNIRMLVALALLPRLNLRTFLPLFEHCGGIEGFFLENEKNLHALYAELHIPGNVPDRRAILKQAEQEMKSLDRHHIRVCSSEHLSYPSLLTLCPDAPLVFFYKGELDTTHLFRLAIVGTRKASERCKNRIDHLVRELAESQAPLLIVSGLAYGIDISAHRASIKYGLKTYAVLGHGLNLIYPVSHRQTAEKILEAGGALLSEFPCSSTIRPVNFLQRNRIIAGLSHATLVAESAEKGGAMATARMAWSYNRDVMAIPGRPDDQMSAGCNLLIKQNLAALTENATDIVRMMGLPVHSPKETQTSFDFFDPDKNEKKILQLFREKGELDADSLSRLTHIPVQELQALLLQLELKGRVISLSGNRYLLC